MASLHQQPGRPFWFCAFSADGRRFFRSTKATNKKQAQAIANKWERAAKVAARGLLTTDRAREIISEGIADIFEMSDQGSMPKATIRAWFTQWLQAKSIEASDVTHSRYKGITDRFLSSLGNAADKDIATLSASQVMKFRDAEARRVSIASANLAVKVIRAALQSALRQEMINRNPASVVSILKKTEEARRRAFTVPELKRILKGVDEDVEWRGLILFGLYTGQRLGDLVRLTWRNVTLSPEPELALTTRKTGRRLIVPLMPVLADYLEDLNAPDNPDALVFPTLAKMSPQALSNGFVEILVEAGLAKARTHQKKKRGRDARRETSELSFHSLRHSAVTMLKAAGVSEPLVMQIVGHDSAAVSRGYTHLSATDARKALAKMPKLK
jgi:integrase